MQVGVDSFAAVLPDRDTGAVTSGADRLALLLAEVVAADRHGVEVFGVGEHHRPEFLDAAPTLILAAAAAVTTRIRLTSAVTVLAADPVRVFQQFATLDLLSRGRAEIVVGRGSFGEAFPLFGVAPQDYDAAFAEKLELLLALREGGAVTFSGAHRPPLHGQAVHPRPVQPRLPIWLGVGGTSQSFVRAGTLGLPLMLAVIGGSFERFAPLVDLYRSAGAKAGHASSTLKVGLHAMGFVADDDWAARDLFYAGWSLMMGRIGVERGWAPPSRAGFDALCGPGGAFLVGGPEVVTAKILDADRVLGGLARVTLQMSSAAAEHAAMLRSIELLGTAVMPRLRSLDAATAPA